MYSFWANAETYYGVRVLLRYLGSNKLVPEYLMSWNKCSHPSANRLNLCTEVGIANFLIEVGAKHFQTPPTATTHMYKQTLLMANNRFQHTRAPRYT